MSIAAPRRSIHALAWSWPRKWQVQSGRLTLACRCCRIRSWTLDSEPKSAQFLPNNSGLGSEDAIHALNHMPHSASLFQASVSHHVITSLQERDGVMESRSAGQPGRPRRLGTAGMAQSLDRSALPLGATDCSGHARQSCRASWASPKTPLLDPDHTNRGTAGTIMKREASRQCPLTSPCPSRDGARLGAGHWARKREKKKKKRGGQAR